MKNKKYREAARRIIQEEYLNKAIRKPGHSDMEQPGLQKLMVCLKARRSGQQYVFDLAQGVSIGRNSGSNDICLQDLTASGNHCKLFQYKGQIWIRDMNSANGTLVKRGLYRPVCLRGTQLMLKNNDRITVGNTVFRVEIFYYDLFSM